MALPAAAVAAYFYYFIGRHFSPLQRRALALLRFLALSLLAVLLLRPLLEKTEMHREKPLLLWLDDRSQSILAHDSAEVLQWYQDTLPRLLAPLREKYRLRRYGFGAELGGTDSGFSASTTNIATALRTAQGRHFGEPVAGMVLVSDGIYNRGTDPRYLADGLPYPLYTLGMGDTTARRDAALGLLRYNEIAYQGNRFPVEIPIQAQGYAGSQAELRLRRLRDDKVLYRQEVNMDRNSFFQLKKVYLEAPKTGVWRYAVELDTMPGEAQTVNNQRRFSVEVLSTRKKIALVAPRPHPDLAAIRRALEGVLSYRVALFSPPAEMPSDSLFDLYIYYNPSREILRANQGRPRPFLLWAYTPEALRAADALLPGQWQPRGNEGEKVQAYGAPDFAQFTVPEATQQALPTWPPVQTRYGRWQPGPASHVLLWQRIGQVNSDRPLWLFGENAGQRYGLFLAGNVWRWRLYAYRQKERHAQFDRLLQQAAQYLMAKNIRDRLQVEAPVRVSRQESWHLRARLYNAAYELVNRVPLELRLRSDEGKAFRYRFTRRNDRYILNVQNLPAGHYTWQARAVLGGDTLRDDGEVVVRHLEIERQQIQARHALLRSMSNRTGGAFYPRPAADSLVTALVNLPEARSTLYTDRHLESILSWWWLFFAVLAMWTAEWGLRKYWGRY